MSGCKSAYRQGHFTWLPRARSCSVKPESVWAQADSICWGCTEEEKFIQQDSWKLENEVLETHSGLKITSRAAVAQRYHCPAGRLHSLLTSYVSFILVVVLQCPSLTAVFLGGHNSCRVLSQKKPPVLWDQAPCYPPQHWLALCYSDTDRDR